MSKTIYEPKFTKNLLSNSMSISIETKTKLLENILEKIMKYQKKRKKWLMKN